MRKIVLLSILSVLTMAASVFAQDRRVTGTVTDADGLPLAGVTIIIKGTQSGVTTSTDGTFSIQAPANTVLQLSFVGYERQDVELGNRTNVSIVMNTSSEKIDDVIVVAYGTAKKESFTGSVEMIKPDEIVKRNTSNVSKALEGSVAGIITTSGGGQPGVGSSIRIRGTGSMNASNDPLYVVDGIPYDGALSAINSNDVESISVLKDASASALYGARGANGVIIITTKKGKSGKTVLNLKADWGFSKRGLEKYETVNVRQYMELAKLIWGDGFMTNSMGGERYNPFNVNSADLFDENGKVKSSAQLNWNENWMDEAEQTAFRQEYQLSATGGNENTQYYASLGFLDEEGVAKTTEFKRYSANVRVDTKATEWMKLGVSLMASHTKSNYIYDSGGSAYTNLWYSALNMAPIYPVYEKDSYGNTVTDENGKKIFDYGKGRPYGANSNAVGALYNDPRNDNRDNLSLRTYVTFDTDKDIPFLKDLSATISFGTDYYNRNIDIVYSDKYGQFVDQGGYLYKYNYRNLSYTFNQLINYSKKIGRHSVDLLLGHEYYDMKYNRMDGQKSGAIGIPGNTEFPAYAKIEDLNSRGDLYRVESYFSRLNYNFNDRYYFSASFRTDGSSRFKDNRWGNFWSVGASWRISQEKFLSDVTWLNNLTFKISYGEQGNDNLSQVVSGVLDNRYYIWQDIMDLDYGNGNMGGVYPKYLGNRAIKWEKNKNMNIGVETTMFNNRLRMSFEFYIKKTSDLLMNRPKAVSTGFEYYPDNVGSMKNTGIDLTLGGVPVQTGGFKWDVTFIASHWKNKVTKLHSGLSNLPPTNMFITKVGHPIDSFYPVLHAGVNPDTGAQQYKYYEKDKYGVYQTVITEKYSEASNGRTDKNIVGSRTPKLLGSLTNTFEYKGFDLSVMFTYSIGGKIYDAAYFELWSVRSPGSTYPKEMYNKAWRKPGDITKYAKPVGGNTIYSTDLYLTNASYLALKNFSFGYTFKQDFLKRAGISSIRLSVTGNNLYTWSHRKGMDPQYSFRGTVDYTYVPIKNVSFGLDINF